jgi:hypothetical protein
MDRRSNRRSTLVKLFALALLGALPFIVASRATAASPVTINITDSGADASLPIGSAFTLAGNADPGVTEVVPVFVRVGLRSMFGKLNGKTCGEFKKDLDSGTTSGGQYIDNAKHIPSPTFVYSHSGRGKASEIWAANGHLDGETPIFIAGRWTSSAGGDSSSSSSAAAPSASSSSSSAGTSTSTKTVPFQVLVPESDFFDSNGIYCLFVISTSHKKTTDTSSVQNALLKYPTDALQCPIASTAPMASSTPAGASAAAPSASSSTSTSCIEKARADLAKAVDDTLAKADPTSRQNVKDAANTLFSDTGILGTAPGAITRILTSVASPAAPLAACSLGGSTGPSPPITCSEPPPAKAESPYRSTTDKGKDVDWLAVALMRLLGEKGALIPSVNKATQTIEFYTNKDPVFEVVALRLLSDVNTIELTSNPASATTKTRANASAAASDLKVGPPDGTGAFTNVQDLLELLMGNLRVSGTYYAAADVSAHVSQVLQQSPNSPLSSGDAAYLTDLQTRLQSLSDTIESLMAQADAATPSSPGQQALGKWLQSRLVPCSTPPPEWNIANAASRCAKSSSPGVWPGYVAPGENPLSWLASNGLDAYKRARDDWSAKAQSLAVTIDQARTTESSFPLNMEFTQSTWVFSYVTPVTGVGFVMDGASTFPLYYIAAQLTLVPNPVDSPQWTQKDDIWRAVALELGMSTTGGSFGPDSRFSGWNGLPPLFVGGALHLVPYTSFTIGGVLLDRRTSTVTQEQPQTYLGLYLGANVQANIPDLVAALKGRTSAPTSPSPPSN